MRIYPEYDVIIIGGSLVGASLALAANKKGKRILLVDSHHFTFNDLHNGWDQRLYAISPANQTFLQGLGAWPDASRICAVSGMAVYGDAGGQIQFDARKMGVPALAWILENRWLLAKLWAQIRLQSSIDLLIGTQPQQFTSHADHIALTFNNGQTVSSALLVGADGAHSWVRQYQSIPVASKPYEQSAVVANFDCERPHLHIARQWFTGAGILAWLPLPGNKISIVWSTPKPDQLMDMSADKLAKTVAATGHHVLGHLQLITAPALFPLCMRKPKQMVTPRVALVGDAAHTIHPLAGQGVNLGFQDVRCLSEQFAQVNDVGNWVSLRRYERERLTQARTMQNGCDGLYQLFNNQFIGLSWLRNTGLSWINASPLLKRPFAKHALGY